MKGKIYHIPDPDDELENWPLEWTDVTEAVKALYDLVLQSEGWGSNFFTVEDVAPVLMLSELCEFEETDYVRHYMMKMRGAWELAQFTKTYPGVKKEHWEPWPPDKRFLPGDGTWIHDHVFNSSGDCIWSGCYTKGEPDPRILALQPYPYESGKS